MTSNLYPEGDDDWRTMCMGFNTQLWNMERVTKYYGENSWRMQMIRLRNIEDQFTRRIKPYSKHIDVSFFQYFELEHEKGYRDSFFDI